MSRFTQELSEYAELIKNLGDTKISSDKNLSERLIFNEISYWDVFSPEMCWRHLVTASSATSLSSRIKLLIKPKFILCREWVKRKIIKYKLKDSIHKDIPNGAIFFLAFMPRMYLDILVPVILKLKKQGNKKIVVLTDSSGSTLKYPKIPGVIYRDVWSFWNKSLEKESGDMRKIVSKELVSLYSRIKKSDAKKYFLKKHGRALGLSLKMLFRIYIPLILEQAIISKYILNKYKPKNIISPDTSDARVRLYRLFGKNLNISSLDIQFGLTGPEGVEWKFFLADKVAVWGQSSKNVLIKHGVKKEKIFITGSPRHDSLIVPNNKSLIRLRKKYKLTSANPIVLFASTYVDKSHFIFSNSNVLQDMKKAIFETAKTYPDIIFLVKPHPVENIRDNYALGKNCKNLVFIKKEEDISLLINLSDYFISFGSTSTIDALIANKLSICPVFPGWPFSRFFEKSKVVLIPKSKDDLLDIFYDISHNTPTIKKNRISNSKDFLKNLTYKVDGMSSHRVTKLVLGL
jgi:hypothetical protein